MFYLSQGNRKMRKQGSKKQKYMRLQILVVVVTYTGVPISSHLGTEKKV